LYRDAEVWSELLRSLGGGADGGPEALKEGWRLMLLNQFHDIIPGTAITEAYETSREQYEQIFAAGTQERDRALRDIALRVAVDSGQGTPYVLFNSLGWERTDTVILRGGPELRNTAAYGAKGERLESDYVPGGGVGGESELRVTVPAIPAFGYAAIWLRERPQEEETQQRAEAPDALGASWETASYLLEFNERGEITRWLDKANERELLRPGAVANELQLFHDRPLLWDAWDIDPRYEEQRAERVELLAARTVLAGDTADILRFEWRLNESRIEQELILHHRDRRVDFRTRVDWRERHKLLKAAFPFELVSQKATYEIPFGALERATHRNTSWEQAQYEVYGHRWADVSEGDYGISLLNDCKYGYDIRGGTMRLSLLRAPTWPDEFADIGEHEFTYSLYPHDGDWRAAQVVRKACELNHPVVALAASDSPAHTVHPRSLPTEGSLMRYSSQSVILDTIKPAERGKGTVVRLYESCGSRDKAIIALPPTAKRALLVNLLEEALEELDVSPEGTLELSFKPYEIRTIRMEG
jgi:alpha-mannosidase